LSHATVMSVWYLDFNLVIYSSEQIDSVVRQMKDPANGLEITNRRSLLLVTEKCFVASEFIKWIQARFGWVMEEALFFACLLSTRRLIHNTTDREAKFENNGSFWRFQSDEPGPLNWKYIQITPVEETPCVIVEKLLKDIITLVHYAVPKEGSPERTLDALMRVASTSAFQQFERDTAILQVVSLNFTADEKLAFWVNTYNLLCFHALITRIHAKATNPIAGYWERLSFFQEIQYVIGSYLFSLDDIKNGILRTTVDYWSTEDPRKGLGVERREPRVHTMLTCLTKSSPQPSILYHDKVEHHLDLACKRFFSRNVTFEGDVILLPRVVSEYAEDFLLTKENIVQFLWPLLGKDQRTQLHKLINKKFSLKYHEFKWEVQAQLDDFDFVFSKSI